MIYSTIGNVLFCNAIIPFGGVGGVTFYLNKIKIGRYNKKGKGVPEVRIHHRTG